MTYRHATNLHTPFQAVDLEFLALLGDYRIGPPVPARCPTALSKGALKRKGVVGLYVSAETLSRADVKRRSGWDKPENVLGKSLNQASCSILG